jgi:hypothetical protein
MAESPRLQFRVFSDDTFVDELAAEMQRDGTSSVSSRRPVIDPSNLGLDLRDVAELVGMVPSLTTLATLIAEALRRHRPPRLVVESPLGRLVFEPAGDMSADEVRTKLQQLSAVF